MMTAGKDYGVRVKIAYGMLRVGQIIFPNGMEREYLVKSGRVEAVTAPRDPIAARVTKRSAV